MSYYKPNKQQDQRTISSISGSMHSIADDQCGQTTDTHRPHHNQQTTRQQHFKVHGQRSSSLASHHSSSQQPVAAQISDQVQRKIVTFLYLYAILIVALFAAYATYYFCLQNQAQVTSRAKSASSGQQQDPILQQASTSSQQMLNLQGRQTSNIELEEKFDLKIKFLEKYVESLAIDLQETKNKLKEREKCDCQLSCMFNGTRYAEKSSWQNGCDICTCKSGQISCQPQKCPTLNCDDPVQVPGKCCPTCMKRCRYKTTVLRHGQKFRPSDSDKECKCQDGRIKCETSAQRAANQLASALKLSPMPAARLTANNNTDNHLHLNHRDEQLK